MKNTYAKSPCTADAPAELQSQEGKSIVLAGNPNVGKSVFFGYLTGMYVDVSNYPGTTIEIAKGRWNSLTVVDTPGIYGVSSFNDEEKVARDIILSADIILNVVDATRLERDLFLTQQLIDMGKPVTVALNFLDEVEKSGLTIDVAMLSDLLGVEVIPTSAIRKEGMDLVKNALPRSRRGQRLPYLEGLSGGVSLAGASPAETVMILEGDRYVAERHGIAPGDNREDIYMARRNRVNDVVRRVVQSRAGGFSIRDMLGRAAINPLTGIPLLAAVLYGMYEIIGVWVAGTVVGVTEETIMLGYYEPWIKGLVSRFASPESFLGEIMIGEFGMLTMTITYLLGLLLPLVVGFYFVLSVLEDSGYLPRLATLVDRLMNAVGLNGRAVIPIILGFGCVQLGTITTRLLATRREKSITTALLNLAIPCSAQIGVIVGMLAPLGGKMVLLYSAVIFLAMAIVGTVLNLILPGKSSPLLIDLPPMRLPRLDNLFRKTFVRTFYFMKEASPWFLLGSFAVAVLQVFGGLNAWQGALQPLIEGWLRLPKEAATAFVMGMVRRDFGAAGLTDLAMSPIQVVTSLIVITLFVPCIASLMVLFKERGPRDAMLVWSGSWGVAFLLGGVFSQLMM